MSKLIRTWPSVSLDQCEAYHYIDLPNGEVFEGQWDLRGRMPEYIGNEDVKGKTVLDIGCASGFLSFEMERLGAASVVSFDADDHRRIANIPIPDCEYVTNRPKWQADVDAFLTQLKNGYWYCHDKLGSKASALYGDVYDLPVTDQAFDLVVLGQILVHLRDPMTAIGEAARAARETLVIAEGVYDSSDIAGTMHARDANNGPPYIWWLLSLPWYENALSMFGFEIVGVHEADYTCVQHEYTTGEIAITTIVAKRKG